MIFERKKKKTTIRVWVFIENIFNENVFLEVFFNNHLSKISLKNVINDFSKFKKCFFIFLKLKMLSKNTVK